MYVTDTSSHKVSEKTFGPSGNEKVVAVATGRDRYQYGWRTQGTGDIVSSVPGQDHGSTWGAVTRNFVEGNLEYDTRSNGVVHRRDYTETEYRPGGGSGVVTITRKRDGSTTTASHSFVSSVQFASRFIPKLPSEEEGREVGSELMRASVPSEESINLVQVLGETMESDSYLSLRKWAAIPGAYASFQKQWNDAKGLAGKPATAHLKGITPASPRKLVATSAQALGSAFLSYVFGVQPSLNMYLEAAQALQDTMPRIRRATSGMEASWHRTRNRTLTDSHMVREGSTKSSGLGFISADTDVTAYVWTGTTKGLSNSPNSPFSTITKATRSGVRSFCTFERFVTRPSGFNDRLDRYGRAASAFLGGGLTPSVAWELTPFSFAVDWFLDVGGILAYQEAIARDNLVAGMSGYTTYSEAIAVGRWAFKPRETSTYITTVSGGSSASTRYRKSSRNAGGAYGAAGSGLNPTRAAIVGALGTSWL